MTQKETDMLVEARRKYISKDPKMVMWINLVYLVRIQNYDMVDAARCLMHCYNWAKDIMQRYDKYRLDG